jgi:TonB-dependent receptor
VFTWTGGANPYDSASYTPFVITAANTTTQPVPVTSTVFNKRDTITDTNEVSATVNASYLLPIQFPITIKTGLDTVNRRVNNRVVFPRRWYGVVGSVLPTSGLMPLTEFERQNGGPRLPVYDPAAISTTLNDPTLWYEDVNFTATQQYTNRRIMEEGVDAAYIQGSTRLGKLNVLGGIRGEWVTTDTFTYFRARTTPIAAEPDHFKRAALDYARLSRDGSYHKFFPGIHLAYDITSNLKARASWSNSYGRPKLADLVSSPSPNDTARTVSLGNPALKPQLAKNIDVKLEYYFGSSGMVSVTGYRKTITDYIGATASRSGLLVPEGADNGFDGLYGGYELIQVSNLGDAKLRGFEADFRQRMTFLPGALKGLTVRANYTYLETEGRFSGSVNLKPGQVPDFVPRAYNLGVLYTYGKFGANYDLNYTGRYPVLYSLTSPGSGNVYRRPWTVMNAGITYKIRAEATLFLNVNNIEQEGPERYTYMESRPRSLWIVPRSVKFGVTGQF